MKEKVRFISVPLFLLILLNVMMGSFTGVVSAQGELDPKMALYRNGNQIVNGYGQGVRLMGVNVPELSWATIENGIANVEKTFDIAIETFGSNLIRLAVAPAYWNNGIYRVASDGKKTQIETAEEFRQRVDRLIAKAAAKKKYVLLDNHSFYAPRQDSFDFWSTAAPRYADNPYVIYGLFNEPVMDSWEKWKNGGYIKFEGRNDWGQPEHFEGNCPGMQDLLTHLRSTGAKNLVTISGNTWGYDLEMVTSKDYRLTDAPNTNGIMFETHIYPGRFPDYDVHVGVAAKEYPVIVGECGPMFHVNGTPMYYTDLRDPGARAYMANLLAVMDKYELHLAAWSIGSQPSLTTAGGTLNEYGKMIQNYIDKTLKEKTVTLYSDTFHRGSAVSLNTGLYTSAQLSEMGMPISSIKSIQTKASDFQYAIVFMENANGSGKVLSISNNTNNISTYSMDFTPKAILIQRFEPRNLLTKDTVSFSGDFDNYADIGNILENNIKSWVGRRSGPQTIIMELDKPYLLTGLEIDHAGVAGEAEHNNTYDFNVSLSDNGKVFVRIITEKNNTLSQTKRYFDPVVATHIKITINVGQIADTERACLVNVRAYGTDYQGQLKALPGKLAWGTSGGSNNDTSSAMPPDSSAVSSDVSSEASDNSSKPGNAPSQSEDPEPEFIWVPGETNWPLTIGLITGVVVLAGGAVIVILLVIRRKKKV